jgi:hypothetical protein
MKSDAFQGQIKRIYTKTIAAETLGITIEKVLKNPTLCMKWVRGIVVF